MVIDQNILYINRGLSAMFRYGIGKIRSNFWKLVLWTQQLLYIMLNCLHYLEDR